MQQLFFATVSKVIKFILYILYPCACRNCQRLISTTEAFCSKCLSLIRPIASQKIKITSKHDLKIFAISGYSGPIKSLIHKKFNKDLNASKLLGKLIFDHTDIKNIKIDFIIPIPLHWTRYASRGFNQSYLMAKTIGKNLNVEVIEILTRKKKTSFQSSTPLKQRDENLKNAFFISKKFISSYKDLLKDKNILFVDDLSTTGATLTYAAKTLVSAQPKALFAAVAARAT